MVPQAVPLLGSSQGLGVFALYDDLEGIEWISSNHQPQAVAPTIGSTQPPVMLEEHAEPPAGVFYTASNKPIKAAVVDASAKKHAEQLLGDLLDTEQCAQQTAADCPPAKQTMPQAAAPLFSTASGRPLEINAVALQRAAALLGEDTVGNAPETPAIQHEAHTPTAAPCANLFAGGFTTASGKPQAVSELAMRRAQALLGDVLDAHDDAQETQGCRVVTAQQHTSARLGTVKRVAAASTGARKKFRCVGGVVIYLITGCMFYTHTYSSPLMDVRVLNTMAHPRHTRFATVIKQQAVARAPLQTRPRILRGMVAGMMQGSDAVALPTLEQVEALVGGDLAMLRNVLSQRGVDPVAAHDAWVCHHARCGLFSVCCSVVWYGHVL